MKKTQKALDTAHYLKGTSCLMALCTLLLWGCASQQAAFKVSSGGPAATWVGSVTTCDTSKISAGYVLFSPGTDTTYLINKITGGIVHQWYAAVPPGMAVYLFPDGSLLRAGELGKECKYPGGLIAKYNINSVVEWTDTIYNANEQQTHDIYPMPGGHVLVDVWENISLEEQKHKGRTQNPSSTGLWTGKLVELAPDTATKTAKVIWMWRLWDHVTTSTTDPYRLNVNYIGETPVDTPGDWTHQNAVVYNSALDQIMFSSRNLNEIYIINHNLSTEDASKKGGDFLYRWGNPQAYGKSAIQQLFGQHSPYWLEQGYDQGKYIMVNNDGYGRNGSVDPGLDTTTVNVIAPPMNGKQYVLGPDSTFGPTTDSLVYTAPDSLLYTQFRGNAQLQPNGNILIDAANDGIFYEVDKAGTIVWQFKLNGTTAFRCTQYSENDPGVKLLLQSHK